MLGRACLLIGALIAPLIVTTASATNPHSVARQWNEELLEAIRNDFARPTVHARNLYHASVAMWDAWAAYDTRAQGVIVEEAATAVDIQAAREEALSYAVYRLLSHRFQNSPGNDPENPNDPNNTLNRLRQQMLDLGYDPTFTDASRTSPASLGVRIGNAIIAYGLEDGANEGADYANQSYAPINPPLDLDEPGNPELLDPNRWQPLTTDGGFVDQSGNQVGLARDFLGAEWGNVAPFSFTEQDASILSRDGSDFRVYLNPGPPPRLGFGDDERQSYIDTFMTVLVYASRLTPDDGVTLDISPASVGNNTLGTNDGNGYSQNPVTGLPYTPQVVPRGDFLRVIAEYWADGPASETPPGHWFTIYNRASDQAGFERRLSGQGPVIDPLDWDVFTYLALGGAVHDAAVSAWSIKGYYDYIRPVSALRYMADLGQSTEPSAPDYHPSGLPLVSGLVERITPASSAAGERHEHLAAFVGELAIYSWRGHVDDPVNNYAGVGWIRAGNWWPYQQADFVTPPFAGFVSGHSTFSRAAAETLTQLTGSPFFPGGLQEYCVPADSGLEFERGPSVPLCLRWASYYDAADQSGISRIFGSIHPPADDIPGRLIGDQVGRQAVAKALAYQNGEVRPLFKDGFEAR
jgi:hypothetical protein